MRHIKNLLFWLIPFFGIPFFFIFANWFVFELPSFYSAFVFSKSIVEGLANGLSIRDLRFEIFISLIFALIPFLGVLYIKKPQTTKATHGKARWATEKDIECFKFISKDGFLKFVNPIGVNFEKGFVLGLWKKFGGRKVCYDKPLGCLIVAPPGAGKSASVAIPNLLTIKTSCIVTDIKKELYQLTAGYRQKALKNKVLIFDPFGEDNTCFFNPFDYKIVSKMNFNQKYRLVNEVANTIFSGDTQNKNGDDHWVARAKDLFVFYALYDLCTQNCSTFFDIAMGTSKNYISKIHPDSRFYGMLYKRDNLGNFVRDNRGNLILEDGVNPQVLFYQQVAEQKYADLGDPRNWIEETQEQIDENVKNGAILLDEIVRNDARSWAQMAEDEFNGIKSTFNRIVSVFKSYQVKDATDHMSFEYEDFRKENISLYIAIAQTDIETLAPLIRILLESIAKNLLLKESKKEEERIYFILDEFVRFGKLPFLLEMPALCRSYGVVPLFITQSYSLIKKYYSEDDLKILKEVVAYQILFKMNGADDAEMVAKEVGKYTRLNRNTSTKDGTMIFGGSSSYSHEGAELITAQDVLNIPDDEVIVIATGNKAKPLLLKANYYFKNKKMLKMVGWKLQKQPLNESTENAKEIKMPKTQEAIIQEALKSQKEKQEKLEKELNQQVQEAQEEKEENEKKIIAPIILKNTEQLHIAHQSIEPTIQENLSKIEPDSIADEKIDEASSILLALAGFEEESQNNRVIERNEYVVVIRENIADVSLKKPHKKSKLDKKLYQKIVNDLSNLKIDPETQQVSFIDEDDRKAI